MVPHLLTNLCRLCLVKDNVSTPIFGEVGVRRGLHMKITTCLPVQVSKDDELPKMICVDCLNKVEQTFIFRKSTANAEKHLLRLLSEAKKQKVIVDVGESHHTKKEVSFVGNKQDQECNSNTIFIKEEWNDDETDNPPPLAVSYSTNYASLAKPVQQQQTAVTVVSPAQPILSTENRELTKQPLTTVTLPTPFKSSGYPENAIISHGNERKQSGEEKNDSATDSCTEEPGSRLEEQPKKTGITLKACEFCGKLLPNGKLLTHRRMHTGERPFVCTMCTETFISKHALRRHSVIHSDARPYSCDVCLRRFKRSFTLNTHRKLHFSEKTHVCDICGYSCVQRTNLVKHRRRHFNEYTVRCHICNKGFYSNAELRLHLNGHTGDRPHQCHICGLTFRIQKGLSEHLKTHIPGYVAPPQKTFCCDLCGKCFLTKPTLKRHIKQHTGDNRRPCEICGKLCSVDYLKVHIRTHTGEKPEKCGVCGKSFVSKTQLTMHMRTHTGERPYKCNDCGKAFTQCSSLAVHKRSITRCTTDSEQFVCHCGESFHTNKLLTNHLTTKHN